MRKTMIAAKGNMMDAEKWLDGVVAKPSSMTQRKLSSVERMAGGLASVRKLAQERGVHLLLLEDDKGDQIIAASTKVFKVIC
jgi:hypothetical protein